MKATLSANLDNATFDSFMARMQQRVNALVADGTPLFTTDAEGLYGLYLSSFTKGPERQYHTCSACRHFIEHFGGLVSINERGDIASIWNPLDAPPEYQEGITYMRDAVEQARRVTGVFVTSERVLGQPRSGGWSHFHLSAPAQCLFTGRVQTAGQRAAELREDHKNVMYALNEFTQPIIEQALTLLETDSLYRSEKVIGPAKWLHSLHVARAKAKGPQKTNVVWRAIATAPAGFAHPRSSMIGTLLEDLAAGKSFDQVSRSFAAKMHPLQYLRPQAAPTAGNIAQAERIFTTLGLAPALERRIARIDEVPLLWRPKSPPQPSGKGIFGHIQPKGSAPTIPSHMGMPAITITVDKFVRTVAPNADRMQVHLNASRLTFIVITAPVNPDAPLLFQWDHPFAWYVWHGGAPASQYGLTPGWTDVDGITRLPARWNDAKPTHQGDGLIMLFSKARETRLNSAAIFPETLRSDLHPVRSVIEAHSRSGKLQGREEGSAIGYDLRDTQGGQYPVTVRVTSGGRVVDYKLDRWD